MKLIDVYHAAIEKGEIEPDPLQEEVLRHMQRLADELSAPSLFWGLLKAKKQIPGLYLYGPVGVGKTYLVDLFFEHLPERRKARFHFHHFMQQIDAQLRKVQGQKDPLRRIAKEIGKNIRVLCFDEFLVHDVAYAMILAELLLALHAQGVILVISSNTAPDDLYKNGVQRQRFLPAIELIKKHCDIVYLNEQRDYRIGRQPLLEAYLCPLNERTNQLMSAQFAMLVEVIEEHGLLRVQNREIPYVKYGSRAIWFAFDILCNLPRSQLDYLEIANRFDIVFLSDIPRLTSNHTAQVIMFIHFIDVMYDRGIQLVLSAAVSLENLYVDGEMKETFNRTLSRLTEMQSIDYLHRHPHRMFREII